MNNQYIRTDRTRLLTLLGWLADEDAHAQIISGTVLNGNTDLADIVEMWGDAVETQSLIDLIQSKREKARLQAIFDWMLKVYCDQDYPNMDWLYGAAERPDQWVEYASIAREILEHEMKGSFEEWKRNGRLTFM